MISLNELLTARGFKYFSSAKIVRHIDHNINLSTLYKVDYTSFLEYQNHQMTPVFDRCNYIISFIGEEGFHAKFIGIFKIIQKKEESGSITISNREFKYKIKYTMLEINGYEDFKERIVIRWNNPRCWHQWVKRNIEILEISKIEHINFHSYTDVVLSFTELKEIFINKYNDWKTALSSVNGIYLITDILSGKQYIGSSYGKDGIWGRWEKYVQTNGHGENKSLEALISKDSNYANKYFQFSILSIFNQNISVKEIIYFEQLYKKKLGTNSFGLNNN